MQRNSFLKKLIPFSDCTISMDNNSCYLLSTDLNAVVVKVLGCHQYTPGSIPAQCYDSNDSTVMVLLSRNVLQSWLYLLISTSRGRSYKRLLEYLFFMWDPSLLSGNSEPIRVLEEGFRPAAVYEVCSALHFTLTSTSLKQLLTILSEVKWSEVKWSEVKRSEAKRSEAKWPDHNTGNFMLYSFR